MAPQENRAADASRRPPPDAAGEAISDAVSARRREALRILCEAPREHLSRVVTLCLVIVMVLWDWSPWVPPPFADVTDCVLGFVAPCIGIGALLYWFLSWFFKPTFPVVVALIELFLLMIEEVQDFCGVPRPLKAILKGLTILFLGILTVLVLVSLVVSLFIFFVFFSSE
jgi:hypothetical protein